MADQAAWPCRVRMWFRRDQREKPWVRISATRRAGRTTASEWKTLWQLVFLIQLVVIEKQDWGFNNLCGDEIGSLRFRSVARFRHSEKPELRAQALPSHLARRHTQFCPLRIFLPPN